MSPEKVFKRLSFGNTMLMGRAKEKRSVTATARHGFTVRGANSNSSKINFALQRTTKSKQKNYICNLYSYAFLWRQETAI